MKKSILLLMITLLTCSSQFVIGWFGEDIFEAQKQAVQKAQTLTEAQKQAVQTATKVAIVADFQNKARAAKTRAEYDKITADYTEFIKKHWPADKSIPPLPSYQQTI